MEFSVLHCTLFSVLCSLLSVICTLYSVICTLLSVLLFFHSLVIDCVAATPSPARENFRANVWWGGMQNYIIVPLRRGTSNAERCGGS